MAKRRLPQPERALALALLGIAIGVIVAGIVAHPDSHIGTILGFLGVLFAVLGAGAVVVGLGRNRRDSATRPEGAPRRDVLCRGRVQQYALICRDDARSNLPS